MGAGPWQERKSASTKKNFKGVNSRNKISTVSRDGQTGRAPERIENGQELWLIDCIVSSRHHRGQNKQYLIRWHGWSDPSWEDAFRIDSELITIFERAQRKSSLRRQH